MGNALFVQNVTSVFFYEMLSMRLITYNQKGCRELSNTLQRSEGIITQS